MIEEATWAQRRLTDGRFQLTVLGEFSRGKSTLINALLGGPVLPRSMIPCNSGIVRLRYGPSARYLLDPGAAVVSRERFRHSLFSVTEEDVARRLTGDLPPSRGVIELPHPLLAQGVELLDTPGLAEDEQLERLVEAEAERSDAFVLVISAMQPVTKLEAEAVARISRHGKPVFVVCNFMNVPPPSQRAILEKRVREAILKHVPTADVRFSFVSAEPALLNMMGEESDESWTSGVVDLRAALATFLCDERGGVELQNTRSLLSNLLSTARDAVQEAIEKESAANEQKRNQEADRIRRAVEWLRNEAGAVPARRTRMQAGVRQFVQELGRQACSVGDGVMLELAGELPAASKTWTSDRSVLMPWEVAKDFGKQVERFFGEQLNQRVQRALSPVVEGLTARLAADFGQDAAALYNAASGFRVGDLSIDAAQQDPEGAGERLVKSIVGLVLVGPAGLAAGAAPISHIIAMAVSGFVVAFVIVFLGGGPISMAIGVAASTILVVFLGADGMKTAIRDKLVKKVVEEIPGMKGDVHAAITKELQGTGEAIEAELDKEISRLEGETQARLEEAEGELAHFESSNGSPSISRFEDKLRLASELLAELAPI